jgi:hypothetical protein
VLYAITFTFFLAGAYWSGLYGFLPTALLTWLNWPVHLPAQRLMTALNIVPIGNNAYVSQNCYVAVIALLGALVWVGLDRKREHEGRVYGLFRVLVRYVLAVGILAFGHSKIPPMHGFGQPGPIDWVTPFGEKSRGVFIFFWLNCSPLYQTFTGVAEMGSVFLLFFRRTTTLGALIAIASMTHVALINYEFGSQSPVAAANFIFMAALLLAPELKRLAGAFLFNRETIPPPIHFTTFPARWRPLLIGLKVFLIAFWLRPGIVEDWGHWKDYHSESPLRGVYRVESFTRDGRLEPLAFESPTRWRTVAIDNVANRMMVRSVNDSSAIYDFSPSPWPRDFEKQASETASPQGTLTLKREMHQGEKATEMDATLQYARLAPGQLLLEGELDGATLSAHLQRIPSVSFPLFNRHWWVGDESIPDENRDTR